MSDFAEMNRKVIDEFRENGGKVGGMFEGMPLVLLHTTGAKSGLERVNPLAVRDDGKDLYVFASMAGAPRNPDWYYNLRANPRVEVEYGGEQFAAQAVEVTGETRDEVYGAMAAQFDNFREYQEQTERTIPVVALKRMS